MGLPSSWGSFTITVLLTLRPAEDRQGVSVGTGQPAGSDFNGAGAGRSVLGVELWRDAGRLGYGVDHLGCTEPEPYSGPLGDGFRFLHVSSGFPRKGIDVLRAYERFGPRQTGGFGDLSTKPGDRGEL